MRLDKEGGEDCIMCLDCLQADRTRSRMGLILRGAWTREDIGPRKADVPLTLFIMMVSGFVAYELSGFWPGVNEVFLWLPVRFEHLIGLPGGSGWLKGLWIIVGFPLLLWSVLGLCAKPLLRIPGLMETWRRIAYPVSLFVIVAHMTKALEKLSTWSGFLPNAMRDPSGVRTVKAMIDGTIIPPEAIAGPHVILLTGAALLSVAVFLLSSRMRIFTRKEQASVCGDTAGRP